MSAKNKIIFDYRCRSSSSSSSGRRWTSEDRRVSGQKNNTSSLKFTMLSPCNNKRSGRSGHIQSVKLLRTHTCTYKQLQQGAFAPNINLLIGYNRVFFFFPLPHWLGIPREKNHKSGIPIIYSTNMSWDGQGIFLDGRKPRQRAICATIRCPLAVMVCVLVKHCDNVKLIGQYKE